MICFVSKQQFLLNMQQSDDVIQSTTPYLLIQLRNAIPTNQLRSCVYFEVLFSYSLKEFLLYINFVVRIINLSFTINICVVRYN